MAIGQISPKIGKIVDLPEAPIIGTATLTGDIIASVSFTYTATKGGPAIYYRVTSSSGGVTATGNSSPITISGLTPDTAQTFTVAAVNSTGAGPESASSNSITTNKIYQLVQTFTSSGTFTIPAGKSRLALIGSGGGGAGANGSDFYNSSQPAPGGGGGGGVFSVRELTVVPGDTYSVTIGAGGNIGSYGSSFNPGNAGGTTNFANFVTANGGGGGLAVSNSAAAGGTVSISLGATGVTDVSSSGGNGGTGGNQVSNGYNAYGNSGNAGGNSTLLTSNDVNIIGFSTAFGGGGGGAGGPAMAGGFNGGASIGQPGAGGNYAGSQGGSGAGSGRGYNDTSSKNAQAVTGYGGGGGAGASGAQNGYNGNYSYGGAGANGSAGRIYVYVK